MTRAEIVARLRGRHVDPCPVIPNERVLRLWGARRADAQTLGICSLAALVEAADAWFALERPRRASDLWRELADEVRAAEEVRP